MKKIHKMLSLLNKVASKVNTTIKVVSTVWKLGKLLSMFSKLVGK